MEIPGGMYGPAIEKIIYWLKKAEPLAEDEGHKRTISLLIKFYEKRWSEDFDLYMV